ncbi:hypothetical protein [Streptomyces sp. NPDC050564]|uniref:hypothetical protein n=1 Tax=Streptomyces sp. NPDC050564 TaxID=3365631 RepID=UPI0037B2057D
MTCFLRLSAIADQGHLPTRLEPIAGADVTHAVAAIGGRTLANQSSGRPDLGSTCESSSVSRAPLRAHLAHAQPRDAGLAVCSQKLEKHLSSRLGEQAWRESGWVRPHDVEELPRTVTRLEQRNVG